MDECHKVQHTDIRVQFDYFLMTFGLCRLLLKVILSAKAGRRDLLPIVEGHTDDVAIKPVANTTNAYVDTVSLTRGYGSNDWLLRLLPGYKQDSHNYI